MYQYTSIFYNQIVSSIQLHVSIYIYLYNHMFSSIEVYVSMYIYILLSIVFYLINKACPVTRK